MTLSTAVARILAAGVLMALAGAAAAQQDYPYRPIRFIVPYPPGGATDPLARMAAQKLTEGWGQQVIVDNRPGGSSIIGSEALVKSPPDGYTIMLTTNAHVINAGLYAKLPYDAIKDFAAVATIAESRFVLLLNPSVPANNLREIIALAKARPGQLNYPSGGIGGVSHLVSELFNITAGVKVQHIPYKGTGPAVTDLIGGRVQLGFTSPISAISHIKSGKLKAIAISGETRLSALPQVPTFTEAGLPGFDANAWYGVFAPAGTPKRIIDKLATQIAKIVTMPDIKEKLDSQGMDPFISTPAQFAALIRTDLAKYAKVIKTANIKADE